MPSELVDERVLDDHARCHQQRGPQAAEPREDAIWWPARSGESSFGRRSHHSVRARLYESLARQSREGDCASERPGLTGFEHVKRDLLSTVPTTYDVHAAVARCVLDKACTSIATALWKMPKTRMVAARIVRRFPCAVETSPLQFME